MDERTIDAPRAEQVQPGGYVPVPITEQTPAQQAGAAVAQARRDLGSVHLAVDLITRVPRTLQEELENERVARHALDGLDQAEEHLGRVRRALRVIVPALAVALVGVLVGAPTGGQAQAATVAGKTWAAAAAAPAVEGPQPDPAAPVYRVVLSGLTATVRVPLVLNGTVASGLFCGSVWGPHPVYGFTRVGHACSVSRFVTVTATFATSTLQYGPHNTVWISDDSAPDLESAATVDARRRSQFGRGTWLDMGRGDVSVIAPLSLYSPALGGLAPQKASPVQVQELVGGRWVVKATLRTNGRGVASGLVHLGGGRHVVRVVRPRGATVWETRGRARTVTTTTEPLDVI